MSPLVILSLAIGPGLFWLWFFVRRDRLNPEPARLIWRAFFWGAVSVIPAAMLEMPIPGPLNATLGAPIIEEAVKFLVVYLFVFRQAQFDEPMDGITYGVAAALGFATAENIGYVFDSVGSNLTAVASVRAILSVPGHALWAVLWGYGLGRMKFLDGRSGEGYLAAGLGLAMLSHSLFNLTCAASEQYGWLTLLLPVLAIVSWRLANRRTRDALMRGPLRDGAMPLPLPGRHQPPAAVPAPVPPPPHIPPPPPPPHLPAPPPPPHEGE